MARSDGTRHGRALVRGQHRLERHGIFDGVVRCSLEHHRPRSLLLRRLLLLLLLLLLPVIAIRAGGLVSVAVRGVTAA